MASTEAKAKWLPSSCKSESLNDSPPDIKWWSYHQQKVNTDSFWNPECDVKMLEFEAEGEADKLFSGMESEWIGMKKKEPWWRKADLNDLVLLIKSLEHFDNCDLPLPQTSKTKKWLVCDKGLASLNPEKDKYKNIETPNCQLSKAELLEALCRSQRRAREAEKTAHEACNQKEHVITLFLKQASQIFAYKQCLYVLHLEKQLRAKNYHPIYTPFPNPTKRNLPNKMNKSVEEFLMGLALVGAGVLLGWLFHSL